MMHQILEINAEKFSEIDSYAGRVNSAIKEIRKE
jgi:hypothetical protein